MKEIGFLELGKDSMSAADSLYMHAETQTETVIEQQMSDKRTNSVKNLIIVGASGHGKVVLDILQVCHTSRYESLKKGNSPASQGFVALHRIRG